jgi:hypothetical protein
MVPDCADETNRNLHDPTDMAERRMVENVMRISDSVRNIMSELLTCIIFFQEICTPTVLHKKVKSKVKSQTRNITIDGQSASLSWCQAPIWDPRPNFFLFYLIIIKQLQTYLCGAPSLTRSRVCSFQFLLGIASAPSLRSESHGTHERMVLSLFFRLSHPGGSGSCIYFTHEQGSPVIPRGIGFVLYEGFKLLLILLR